MTWLSSRAQSAALMLICAGCEGRDGAGTWSPLPLSPISVSIVAMMIPWTIALLCWSLATKQGDACRLISAALEPVFEINERQRAFVVARALESAVVNRLDPSFVSAGAVAAEGKPHQTTCRLAWHDLSLEQEV